MILADKIIEERKRNGWSQEELAEQLGVSRQSVSKWESAGSVPDLQRIIQLAELFGVSTDYLLKDELLPSRPSTELSTCDSSEPPLRRVSMEEAQDFLSLKRKGAPVLANATALCILSPAVLVVLAALADGNCFGITEGFAVAVGCTLLFAMIATAVFLFITCGIRESHSESLEKEAFETEYGVTGMVREKKRSFEADFTRGLAGGVVLCIVSAVPLILAGAVGASDTVCACLVAVLLLLIAVGVNLIIRVGIIRGSYDTLLQEGDYSQEEKQVKRRLGALSGTYWCLATAIYLAWSFWTMRWDYTWIVWPVAGVLFAVVYGIGRMLVSRKDG